MEFDKKRFVSILGLFTVLVVGPLHTASPSEYDLTVDKNEYEYATPDVKTSTYWECASAQASVDVDNGDCSATTHAYAWVKCDGASAYGEADAAYEKNWVWNGPPGEAPGGTLSWSQDGVGLSSIYGWNNASNAYSYADSYSITWAATAATTSYSWGRATGDVTNLGVGTGTATYGGSPAPWYHDPNVLNVSGEYDASMDWSTWDDDSEEIATGTTLVQFLGGASSYNSSYANATASGVESLAYAHGYASAELWADFQY
jgi:hypothetical protein